MNDASQERMTLLCIYIFSVKTVVFLRTSIKIINTTQVPSFFYLIFRLHAC